MRALVLSSAAIFLSCVSFFAADVQLAPSAPPKAAQSPQAASATPAPRLPQYRPALLGTGPLSVINLINMQELVRKGQKDASLMFGCAVMKNGEVVNSWVYRATEGSADLEGEVFRCLDTAVFVPAIHNYEPVHALFYGTVSFKMVNGKPRLRIFANQEAEELKKESDFVGPQPFVGRDSDFDGLDYPKNPVTEALSGLVELAVKIDAAGNLIDLRLVSEYPPLVGFGRAALEDFRGAKFIPAFRDGKPVACAITLPVYYTPSPNAGMQ